MPQRSAPTHSTFFLLLMILAMVAWGGSWVTAKWASSYPPQFTALWRFFVSALSFLPILWWRKESLALPRQAWLWVGLSAGSLTIYNLLFLGAMQHGPGGYGGVLVPTLNPQFSFLLAALFLHQTVGAKALGGLALGLAGGVLQILGPQFQFEAFLRPENLFLVAAAFVYACLNHFSAVAQREISVFRYSFWTALLCSFFLLPFALNVAPGTPGPFDFGALKADFWINVAYLALAAGTFGTTLYFEATRRVGAARGSSFVFLVPASALVLAFLFLGEQPAWTSVVGGTLSISAVMMIQKR